MKVFFWALAAGALASAILAATLSRAADESAPDTGMEAVR